MEQCCWSLHLHQTHHLERKHTESDWRRRLWFGRRKGRVWRVYQENRRDRSQCRYQEVGQEYQNIVYWVFEDLALHLWDIRNEVQIVGGNNGIWKDIEIDLGIRIGEDQLRTDVGSDCPTGRVVQIVRNYSSEDKSELHIGC